MLIRNQDGTRIIRTDSVIFETFPTGKHGLIAADQLDPEGVVIAIYESEVKAKSTLGYIFAKAAEGKAVDLTTQGK